MSSPLGTHAIVIGAGMGGLAAAKALSRHFEHVTILDKDRLPDVPKPRVGTPQCRLVHVLLEGGRRAADHLVPGFGARAVAAGAVEARVGSEILVELPGIGALPSRDFDIVTLCMTRPLIEHVLRDAVAEQPTIRFKTQCRVTDLVISDNGHRIEGVRYHQKGGGEGTLDADLVVDAASRGDITLKALERSSWPRPEQDAVGVRLTYATAIYEFPQPPLDGWKAVIHRPDPSNGRAGFLFPIEGNRWHVNLAGVHGDAPSGSESDYLEFAQSLRTPTIFQALKTGTMVGSIHRFVLEASTRMRYEKLARFPVGLVPLGDAITRINPAYGQGMSVAIQEAAVLDTLLEQRTNRPDPFADLASTYFERIQDVIETPWNTALMDFVYPETGGKRPADLDARMGRNKALLARAVSDPEAHKLWADVTNLVKPASVLQDPKIAERFLQAEAAA